MRKPAFIFLAVAGAAILAALTVTKPQAAPPPATGRRR